MEVDRSLTARALACLSRREHSRAELRRKLLAPAVGGADTDAADSLGRVEAVLDWLETHNYLSQQRFVESRLRSRASRYGNLRIRQELKQHGVTLPAAAEVALAESEFERACAVWKRKFAREPIPDAAHVRTTAKQARFLASRGFSGETIHRVLRDAHRRTPLNAGCVAESTDASKRERECNNVVPLHRNTSEN